MKKTNAVVIIGGGIAGLSAAKSARKQDKTAIIKIISQESNPPYYRLRICELIGKDLPVEKFYINPLAWYKENDIELNLSCKVLSIDQQRMVIVTTNGDMSYDKLIIASGSTPSIPPFIGKELLGIYSIWNIENIFEINKELKTSRKAVVIGGGLLGLETAYCISQLGIKVTLIEGLPRLLPKQLDEEGSYIFENKVKSLGIDVVTGLSVKEFSGDTHVKKVTLSDGRELDADIVVISVGVKPNTNICSDSGIIIDRFIPVNEKMQVNIISKVSDESANPMEYSNVLDVEINNAPSKLSPVGILVSEKSVSSVEKASSPKSENLTAGGGQISHVLKSDSKLIDNVVLEANESITPCSNSQIIFAAGDVSSFNNKWFGQWSVAMLQGQVAGINAAGGNEIYKSENSPYILSTMGTKVIASGDVDILAGEESEVLKDSRLDNFSYVKLVFKSGILTGGILIGEASTSFVKLQSLIKSRAKIENITLSDFIKNQ